MSKLFPKGTVSLELVGKSPLLMHSPRGVNHFDPLTRELKTFTGKRKKTDDDNLRIAELEFELGIYFDEEIGPYIPARALCATCAKGAGRSRNGPNVKRAVKIIGDKLPLKYEGPRTIKGLWGNKDFVDISMVKLKGREAITRTRPKFNNWSVQFELEYDKGTFNLDDIISFFTIAGEYEGLLDGRAIGYGRFTVDLIK